MKSCLTLLISLLFLANALPEPNLRTLSSYNNPLNNVRKSLVDRALNSLPARTSVSMTDMINYMVSAINANGFYQAEGAYMLYKWIGYNIQYDCYNSYYYPNLLPVSDIDTYNLGRGGDLGISRLFVTMGNALGFYSYEIQGYSKVSTYVQGKLPSQPDHVWNGVMIDNVYYLIDMSWALGDCNVDKFYPAFSDFYFCTEPNIFIRSHLPQDQTWQLVNPTITITQFVNSLKLTKNFYENGFKTVSPDKSSIIPTGTGQFTVTFTFDTQTQKELITHLYYPKGNSYQEQYNACWVDKKPNSAEIKCYASYAGQNKLYIYGGTYYPQTVNYPFLLEYDITVNQNAYKPVGCPEPYRDFLQNKDFHLVEPMNSPLTRGRKYNFKIKSSGFGNLYIINDDTTKNNKHFRELDYQGGVFSGSDVYIFGKAVYIGTYQNNVFNYIAKYNTTRDSSSATDATFPRSYAAKKNTLLSPYTGTIIIGKQYYYEIKCESCYGMGIKEAGYFAQLAQSGTKFYIYYTAYGYDKKLQLGEYYGGQFTPIYEYDLSRY